MDAADENAAIIAKLEGSRTAPAESAAEQNERLIAKLENELPSDYVPITAAEYNQGILDGKISPPRSDPDGKLTDYLGNVTDPFAELRERNEKLLEDIAHYRPDPAVTFEGNNASNFDVLSLISINNTSVPTNNQSKPSDGDLSASENEAYNFDPKDLPTAGELRSAEIEAAIVQRDAQLEAARIERMRARQDELGGGR